MSTGAAIAFVETVFLTARMNGARTPSMADEVATERSTLRWRCNGSRRWGLVLESLELMAQLYHQWQGTKVGNP